MALNPLANAVSHLSQLLLVCLELQCPLHRELFTQPFLVQFVDLVEIVNADAAFFTSASSMHPLQADLWCSSEVDRSVDHLQISQLPEILVSLQVHLVLHGREMSLLLDQPCENGPICRNAALREKQSVSPVHPEHLVELVHAGQERIALERVRPSVGVAVVGIENVVRSDALPFPDRLRRDNHAGYVFSQKLQEGGLSAADVALDGVNYIHS